MVLEIWHIPPLLMLLAMALALWQWLRIPRPLNRLFRLVGVLLLVVLPVEIIGLVSSMLDRTNAMLYNAYGITESTLVLAMLHALKPRWRFLVTSVMGVILLAWLMDAWVAGVDMLLTRSILLTQLLLTVLLLGACWRLSNSTERPLVQVPAFWLLLGLLLFYCATVPVLASYYLLYLADRDTSFMVTLILPGMAMLRYLLIAYACRLETGPGMKRA
jgi:hypothetical protein